MKSYYKTTLTIMAVSAASLSHLIAQTEILVEKVIAHTQTNASTVTLTLGMRTLFTLRSSWNGNYTGAFTVGGDNKT